MAKTYYKYARRNAKPIDFAGASDELSDNLTSLVTGLKDDASEFADDVAKAKEKSDAEFNAEDERRIAEDKAADAAYGDKIGEASKLPIGTQPSYKSVQSTIIDLSDTSAKLNLEWKRARDAGKLSNKDYNIKSNNLSDQFKMLKQSSITSLEMVKKTNEGLKNGTILPIQHKMLMKVFESRFDDSSITWGVDNDGMIVGERVDPKTGKASKISVHELNKLTMQEFEVFDVDAQADSLVQDIGKIMENTRKVNGKNIPTDELLKMEIMQQGNGISTPLDYINKNIDGYNDNQLASILQMKMGDDYEASIDRNDLGNDKMVVYVEQDPSKGGQYAAELTDAQREEAREFARASILVQLNPKQAKEYAPSKPSSASIARGKSIDKAEKNVERLEKIFSGNAQQRKEGLASFSKVLKEAYSKGKDQFISAEIVGNEIVVTKINEFGQTEKDPLPIPDTFEEFVHTVGPTLLGNEDIVTYYDEATKGKDYTGLKRSSDEASYKIEVPEDLSQELVDWEKIAPLIEEMDSFYITYSGKKGDAQKKVKAFIDNSSATGIESEINGDILTVKTDGFGSIDVNLKAPASQVNSDINAALKKVYDAVTTGESLSEGSSELRASLKEAGMTDEEIEAIINAK